MELHRRIRLSRWLTLAFYSLLVCSFIAAQLLADTFKHSVLAFQLAPLFIFLPGLIKGNTKTHVWLACVLLFYSSKFLSDLIVTQGSWISILQALCAIALFATASLYSHWQWQLKRQVA